MFQCRSTQLLCAALVWRAAERPIGSMKVNRKPTYPEKWSAQKGRVSWDGRSGSRLPRLNLSDRESTLTAPPSNTHVHTVLICFTAWCFINVRFLLHCPLFQFSTHCHLKLSPFKVQVHVLSLLLLIWEMATRVTVLTRNYSNLKPL